MLAGGVLAAGCWSESDTVGVDLEGAVEHDEAPLLETSSTDRWPEIESEATRQLHRIKSQLSGITSSRESRKEVMRAEIRLAVARRQARAGNPTRAIVETEVALRHLDLADSLHSARLDRFSDPGNLELWRTMVASVVTEARSREKTLVVDKLRRRLRLFKGGKETTSFRVELGTNGLSPKTREGDSATPEGIYRVIAKKKDSETRYHKALLLDYPNSDDLRRFEARKSAGSLPPHARLGGLIEIHGGGGFGRDWTDGCIALSNQDMDDLYRNVDVGARVVIVGTY